ncbi:hypothetical protein Tco_0288007, partial [Tanacetum coccineum]
VPSKPKIMQEAAEIATKVMDKRIRTFAERQTENKRKQDDNHQQQLQNKRQNTDKAYAAGTGEKRLYEGSKPLCAKCNYHHDGPCAPKCHKYNRVGHLAVIVGVLLMPTLLTTKGVSKTEEQQQPRQPSWKCQCSSESLCGADRSFVSSVFSS